jgi:undecaprenyl-diphosphatase
MTSVDLRIMQVVAHHRIDAVTDFARAVMRVGLSVKAAGLICLVGGIYVVAARRWRLGVSVVVAFVLALTIAWGLKDLIDRPRPPFGLALVHPRTSSMPSTHAAFTAAVAIALCGALDWLSPGARRVACAAAASAVAAVGALMVYLGAHWTSDLVVGWVIGAAIGALVAYGFRIIPNGPAAAGAMPGRGTALGGRTDISV